VPGQPSRSPRRPASPSPSIACDGIFIGGHQYAGGRFCTDIGAPIYVPSEVIAAIIEHAIELEPFLRAYGQFSCGCEYPDDDSNFRDLPTEH
jgi:hypothetical protein